MEGTEMLGYLAALLVFSAFYMKTMLPLRIVAICSNLAFIGYGYLDALYPVLVLHLVLLPLNVLRLVQILRLLRSIHDEEHGTFPFEKLLPYMTQRTIAAGKHLFHAGDEAVAMYYMAEGEVEIEEIGRTLGQGEIVGEIGVLAPNLKRTLSAASPAGCVVYELTAGAVRILHFQNPRFAFAIMRLALERLTGDRGDEVLLRA